jgi:DNA-binding NarL/FixJ family response regulator
LRRRSRGNVEVSNLFSRSKLDLTNCTQAAILAHEAGLLEGDT